jgi:hypothetical protein
MNARVLAALAVIAAGCGAGTSASGPMGPTNQDLATYKADLQGAAFDLDGAGLSGKTVAFVSNPGYLVMNLPLAPYKALYEGIEAKIGAHLKNRGEAHITTILPPEYDALKGCVSQAEMDQAAQDTKIEEADVTPVCVGMGTADAPHPMATFFVVVKSQKLLDVRHAVDAVCKKHMPGGVPAFQPDHFFPHVTLGFTDRDLFEQDGVVKDMRACVADVHVKGE